MNLAEQNPHCWFDPVDHKYYIGGQEVPSVTRILDPLNDFGGIPADTLELARQRGTAVHIATHLDDTHNLVEESVHPMILPYLEAWRKFKADTKPEIRQSEGQVYSMKYRYGGGYDRVLLLSNKNTLLDIKATATIPYTVGPQTAAYKSAYEEGGGERIEQRAVLHLRGDGTYRLITDQDKKYFSVDDLRVFLCALTMHNWRLRHER